MRFPWLVALFGLVACPGFRSGRHEDAGMTQAAPVEVASIPKMDPIGVPRLPPAAPATATAPKKNDPPRPPAAPATGKRGPRVVDFRCPGGQTPNGVVRAGCMCGNTILGDACGTSGFSDVTPTATGCRFVCD